MPDEGHWANEMRSYVIRTSSGILLGPLALELIIDQIRSGALDDKTTYQDDRTGAWKSIIYLFSKTERPRHESTSSETKSGHGRRNDGNAGGASSRRSSVPRSERPADELKFAKILGLNGKITKSDIKGRYRDLVHKYHPDKVSHLGEEFQDLAHRKFQEINQAYEYFRDRYKIG